MMFPEEDVPLLKTWIVNRIEDTSNADAEVLAEYIIALLKHDGDKASVRALCEQEIPDFLSEGTVLLLSLATALALRLGFLPNLPDPKSFLDDVFQAIAYKSYIPGAAPAPKLQPRRPDPPPPEVDAAPSAGHSGSKKRSYNDRDDADPSGNQDGHHNGGRPTKQQRKRGRGRGEDKRGDFSAMGMPSFDPQNPATMEAFMAMAMQYPGMGQFMGNGSRGQPRRRGRCRDFDSKGYCSRGTSCMYDHGNESLYIPSGPQGDEYDPDQAMLSGNLFPFLNPLAFKPENNRGRGGRKGGRAGRKGGGRSHFSAEGPSNDPSKTALVVENIPDESLNETEVRKFFSEFGNINEISMKPNKHLAIIKYDQWDSANAAYQSPKAVFDNRFVKVYWQKDESNAGNGSHPSKDRSKDHDMQYTEDDTFEIDPEEFQQRQEEAQKKFQERETKRAELERQRLELEKKQQELMQKQREERERLQAKLLEKNGGVPDAPSSGADMLRAKIASLEEEAKILGLDPNAAEDEINISVEYPPRGGYRGRSTFRGRATRAWRGSRGSFRGVDGRHAAYAQYSIDNRPKRLAITGVDFTATDKDESLRHFLLSLGEFESVEPSATTTFVSFRDRKTAEKFYNSLHGSELPGVEGKLELSWVNTPLPPVAPPRDKDRDDVMAGMEEDKAGAQPHNQHQLAQQAHEDIDYDQQGDDADAY
ncbi:unnamed protein product [Clonostachys chloroleuca]|uniref:Uncharacterized protein n=1 Tax=Clonostachys chloroleuca TaxID=1926264 RepID=A0AA35QAH2_9HYPO|nr:unnamed protein product [Clonostachys chloroleuca]